MNRVGLIGDWHGDADWAAHAISVLGEHGVTQAFHVGDFGIWPDDRAFVREVNRAAGRAEMHLFVTPGNHEWWERLEQLFEESGSEPVRYEDRITLLPPGHRWVQDGRDFLSLGGAGSIDLESRTEREDWWPGEDVTDVDVARAVAGGPVDVLISHQIGDECGLAVRERRPALNSRFSGAAVEYASRAERQVQAVVDAVRPRVHVHGH